MTSKTNDLLEPIDDYVPPVKLKKTTNDEDHNDLYCFECHDEGDVICCDSCPRVYHCKCLGLSMLPEGDWTCPECTLIQSSTSMAGSSTLFKRHSIEEFHTMLKFTLKRMKSHPHASPFMQPVDPKLMPEYLDYIIYPMDLETIEKNIDNKKYVSTDAFLADIKWIVHNSVVFNGSQSKFTAIARALLKIARHEITEIEICSECYLRSAQPPTPDWFAEPCSIPHTLCWAKMKGYQPWPAKVLRVINDEADVRFFGQHDRAWIPIGNCFILSKEYPGVEKKKSNANFEKSMNELHLHIERLKALYDQFHYAPLQTALSKTKPFKFVSIIDDSSLPTYIIVGGSSGSNTLRSSIKCVKQARSPLPQTVNEASTSMKPVKKRSNENNSDQEDIEPSKRARVLSKPSDDLGGNSSRIVLRIRKPSDDISSIRSEASTSSNSSHPTIVNIKEPLASLKEDDENDMDNENQSQVSIPDVPILDNNELKSNWNKIDDESLDVSPENQLVIASPTGSPTATETSLDLPSPKEDLSSTQNSRSVNEADVKSTIEALLDAIDALKAISEIRSHHYSIMSLSNSRTTATSTFSSSSSVQYAERRVSTKHPRKPRPQPRSANTQAKIIPSVIDPPASFNPIINNRCPSPNFTMSMSKHSPIGSISTEIPQEIPTVTKDPVPIDRCQPLARSLSIDSSSVKSEPMSMQDTNMIHRQKESPAQCISAASAAMSTRSFLISPPTNTNHPRIKSVANSNPSSNSQSSMNSINTMAPRIPTTVSQKSNNWSSTLPMTTSTRQGPTTTNKRPLPNPIYPATAARNSNPNPSSTRVAPPTISLPAVPPSIPQSFDPFAINIPTTSHRPNGIPLSSLTPPLSTRNPVRMPPVNNHPIGRSSIDEQPFNHEIQTIVKCFNDKFQQLLTDFTIKIETALESNRQKYEKELEETRRSYRSSLNELRTVTTQQVQEMHKNLELQYWTRLAEMRHQYESNRQHQMHRPSKHLNDGPRS